MTTHFNRGENAGKDANFQVGTIPQPRHASTNSFTSLFQKTSKQHATTTILMGGGSVSSHSHMKAKSTTSAPGTGHSMRSGGILAMPGVERGKRM